MSWIAVTVATVALISGTISTISAYQQGRAQEDMYKAQADMARMQAAEAEKQAQREAELAQDQAAAESNKLRRQQLQMMGKQKAALAAMGISGVTAEDIIADTTKIQNEDKATLRWNADIASWEAKTTGDYQAWQYRSKSALASSSAKNTRRATNMGLVTNILDTATSTAGGFMTGTKIKGALGGLKATGATKAATSYGGGKIIGKTAQGFNVIGYR